MIGPRLQGITNRPCPGERTGCAGGPTPAATTGLLSVCDNHRSKLRPWEFVCCDRAERQGDITYGILRDEDERGLCHGVEMFLSLHGRSERMDRVS